MPGHTRRLSTVIKISASPPTYIYDTPGIFIPYLGKGIKGNEAALKLALTGGIKESLFEGDTVAEYLLWRLKSRCDRAEGGYSLGTLNIHHSLLLLTIANSIFARIETLLTSLALPPSTSLTSPTEFLSALAIRLSARSKGGDPDVDFAGRYLLRVFREGKFGEWTLDGLGRGGEVVNWEDEYGTGERRRYYRTSNAPAKREPSTIEKEGIPGAAVPESILRSTEEAEVVEKEVDAVIGSFFAQQESPAELSGNQLKKETKLAQARVRDVKRKSLEVVHVKGKGIASARRRNYRR